MEQGPRRAALSILAVASAIVALPAGAVSAQADIATVMIDEIPGFELVDETLSGAGSLEREFVGGSGTVTIHGFAVATPPGPRSVFRASPQIDGMEFIDEPAFELARWMVPTGQSPGDGGFAMLGFVTADHMMTIMFIADAGANVDAAAFVRELVTEQIRRAGSPAPPDDASGRTTDVDPELHALFPETAPEGFGLDQGSLTLDGFAQVSDMAEVDEGVVDFLNRRATGLVKVWGGTDMNVAIGMSRYPYGDFAAWDLSMYESFEPLAVPSGASLPADALLFEVPENGQVGMAFRRDNVLVVVLAEHRQGATAEEARELVLATTALVDAGLPEGATAAYAPPSSPSRIVALLATAGLVVLAVAGTNIAARLRARRLRRRWAAALSTEPLPPPDVDGRAIGLDADASALRRRGAVVAIAQLATITVGVVALSGDFAWVGVAVAILSLVTGLLFTRWWLRREYSLLGPVAPRRALRVPRLSGLLTGIVAFAVLGFGVAFALKGLRYLVFPITVAQLRWSDLFGISPRSVGVLFAVGGLLATIVGAVLWRVARALGRARVREALQADPRPPVLYLRSFADDAVQLPSIASARRPLFELFSLRGADAFEDCVAWELESYGPVVAVGRPGGRLASLGAAREHLLHDTWHDEIEERMRDAGSIALAPGETAGLEWELEAIVRGGHLGKTIFVFPPVDPPQLSRRWSHTAAVLRGAGARLDELPLSPAFVHTTTVTANGALRSTWARTRDEATYRTAVDRAADGVVVAVAPDALV